MFRIQIHRFQKPLPGHANIFMWNLPGSLYGGISENVRLFQYIFRIQMCIRDRYGAMGVALGIVISEVLVLIFVFVIYQGSASGRREAEIGMKGTDTFFSQVRVLLFSMGGDIIGDLLLYLPLWTGLVLFEKNAADIYAAADSYGVFIGRYLDMMLLVVVLLCMGILPGVAKAGAHSRKKEMCIRDSYGTDRRSGTGG